MFIVVIIIMILLVLLVILVYLSIKKWVVFMCVGYLGLYGIGWVVVLGLFDDLFNIFINSIYWGMMLFFFVIVCVG